VRPGSGEGDRHGGLNRSTRVPLQIENYMGCKLSAKRVLRHPQACSPLASGFGHRCRREEVTIQTWACGRSLHFGPVEALLNFALLPTSLSSMSSLPHHIPSYRPHERSHEHPFSPSSVVTQLSNPLRCHQRGIRASPPPQTIPPVGDRSPEVVDLLLPRALRPRAEAGVERCRMGRRWRLRILRRRGGGRF
jgi:hypothetical protein